jgi:hypothetical protein
LRFQEKTGGAGNSTRQKRKQEGAYVFFFPSGFSEGIFHSRSVWNCVAWRGRARGGDICRVMYLTFVELKLHTLVNKPAPSIASHVCTSYALNSLLRQKRWWADWERNLGLGFARANLVDMTANGGHKRPSPSPSPIQSLVLTYIFHFYISRSFMIHGKSSPRKSGHRNVRCIGLTTEWVWLVG